MQLVVCFQKINYIVQTIFVHFVFLKCAQSLEKRLGISDMSRIPHEIKKKFYPLAPSSHSEYLSMSDLTKGFLFTSSGRSLLVQGISADSRANRDNIVSAALGQETNWFKATHKLEQEGWGELLSLLVAATWLLGTQRGRVGKGKREEEVLWKYTSRQPEGLWGDRT